MHVLITKSIKFDERMGMPITVQDIALGRQSTSPLLLLLLLLQVFACVYVCTCVCVRERESVYV